MGIWAEIKYALNSTIGTADFKSLDKLLRFEGKRFAIDSSIFDTRSGGGRSTVPTNTVTGNVVDICSVYPKIGGTWNVQVPVDNYLSWSNETTLYASVLVYINDVYYGQGTYTSISSSSGNVSVNVSFKTGDKISFKLQATLSKSIASGSFYTSCSSLNILAKVVDNLIE